MITVIIPTYNRPDCLKKALGSLALQTDNRFKVLVVDDCSTEDVKWIVDAYIESGMAVEYIKTPQNGGAGAARNYGIDYVIKTTDKPKSTKKGKKDKTSKDYVVFLDSDDLLLPNAIATYNFVLKANPLAKILSTLFLEEHIDKDGNKYYNFAPINNITWIHGRVYSLDFMSDYCIRFPNIRYGEDVAFNSLFYTLAEKMIDATYPTQLRTMELSSLTKSKDGNIKSVYGFLQGVNWYANELNKRKIIDKAIKTQLPNMVAKVYYYLDYFKNKQPECADTVLLAKDFYEKIDFEKLMKNKEFVARFIDQLGQSSLKYVQDEVYTPYETFDRTIKDLGLNIDGYRTLIRTE